MRVKLLVFSLTVLMSAFFIVSCEPESGTGETFSNDNIDSNGVQNTIDPDGEDVLDELVAVDKNSDTKDTVLADVQRWPMISTGQTKCYDAFSEIPCPQFGEKFSGQDGNYQNGFRAYTENGDETVTDSVTGLTWQKRFKADVTWYEADSYCNNLTLSAKKWRIPLAHELKSLIDYGLIDPAIDETAFPDTASSWFWAAKHRGFDDATSGQEASWIINFYDGFVEYTKRYNVYNVRCVRAN